MQIPKKNFSNILLLKIFIVCVVVLVVVSLISKGVGLFLNRSFNEQSFTLLVQTSDKVNVVYLDREYKSIDIFPVVNLKVDTNSVLKNSLSLMIPIDGVLYVKNSSIEDGKLFSAGFLLGSILNKDTKLTRLNNFDLLQIYLFAKSVNQSNIILRSIKKDVLKNNEGDDLLFESIKNKSIVNEGKDIEIYNATEIDGFGGKIAQMLKNEGFNVVLTKSKEKRATSQILFKGNRSNTLRRLEKIFTIDSEKQNGNSIADITLIIGEDIGNKIGK